MDAAKPQNDVDLDIDKGPRPVEYWPDGNVKRKASRRGSGRLAKAARRMSAGLDTDVDDGKFGKYQECGSAWQLMGSWQT